MLPIVRLLARTRTGQDCIYGASRKRAEPCMNLGDTVLTRRCPAQCCNFAHRWTMCAGALDDPDYAILAANQLRAIAHARPSIKKRTPLPGSALLSLFLRVAKSAPPCRVSGRATGRSGSTSSQATEPERQAAAAPAAPAAVSTPYSCRHRPGSRRRDQ